MVIGIQNQPGTTLMTVSDLSVPASLQLFARARASTESDEAEATARAAMRARRQLRPGQVDTFDILTPEAARTFVLNLAQRIGAAAAPISLMALLAAVIVVTNTSLVSVTQRTREIGIRRALGASRRAVTTEVILEAGLTSLGGGIVGLAVASAMLIAIERVVPVELAIGAGTAMLSLVASGGAGVLAGWYPARKAARIDVIEALRQE